MDADRQKEGVYRDIRRIESESLKEADKERFKETQRGWDREAEKEEKKLTKVDTKHMNVMR